METTKAVAGTMPTPGITTREEVVVDGEATKGAVTGVVTRGEAAVVVGVTSKTLVTMETRATVGDHRGTNSTVITGQLLTT